MKNKLLISHLFFFMISGAIVYFQIKETYLIWNMFLALLALDFSFCLNRFKNLSLTFIFTLFWLFFYPNTFYMITDIVHMHWVGDTLWNKTSLHLFMAFVPSILFGVYCGIESWIIIRERLRLTWWLDLIVTGSLSFISSLAIYIGRYDRLNTWDLINNPSQVVEKLLATFQRERLFFILGFTFIQFMSLVFMARDDKK